MDGSDVAVIIEIATGAVVGNVPVGAAPVGIAITSDFKLVVANKQSQNITIL
jgi:DNA-binding beta-propeller fold protein YncE